VNVDEYREHLIGAILIVKMAGNIPVPELLQAIEHAEVVGPVLDPTLYRNKAHAMEQDKELLRAVLPIHQLAKKHGL